MFKKMDFQNNLKLCTFDTVVIEGGQLFYRATEQTAKWWSPRARIYEAGSKNRRGWDARS